MKTRKETDAVTDGFSLGGHVSEQFLSIARHPKNIGSLADASGKGFAIGQCGDSIEVYLRIENETITDIRVIPNGCVYTRACASVMSELAEGRDLGRALELGPGDVEAALGGLPKAHVHCARLAVSTLGEAISDYYGKAANLPRSQALSGRKAMLSDASRT